MPDDKPAPMTAADVARAAEALDIIRSVKFVRLSRESQLMRRVAFLNPFGAPDADAKLHADATTGHGPVTIGAVKFPHSDWLAPYLLEAAEREARAVLLALNVEAPDA